MRTSSGFSHSDRPLGRFIPNPKLRFLDQCREVLRFKQMALRTEEAYVDWIRRFIVWSGKRHPKDMGAAEVRSFLTHLAVERNVAAATQNQALNALAFLYREVIGGEREWVDGFEPAKRGERLPEVLRACLKIQTWVAQATCLCRRATSPAEERGLNWPSGRWLSYRCLFPFPLGRLPSGPGCSPGHQFSDRH